jgi:hypothetical protein
MPHNNILDKIKLFFKIIIIPFLIVNGFIYLIGSFIAQDFTIYNWWVYRTTFGRILLSLIEIMVLVNIPKWWEQYNN